MRSFILLPAWLSTVSGEESSSLIQLKLHRESQVAPDEAKKACKKVWKKTCRQDKKCSEKVGGEQEQCRKACGMSSAAAYKAGECNGYTAAAFNPAELCTKAYTRMCKKTKCALAAKGPEKKACRKSCAADAATSWLAGKCTTFTAPKPAAPKPAKPVAPKPAAPKPAEPVVDYEDDVPGYDVPDRTKCGEWSGYGECTKSCGGGFQYRTFTFFDGVTHDGLKCNHTCPHGNGDIQAERCNEDVKCPVDCEGSWSAFSNCTAPCGGGQQKRVYTVSREADGGEDCPYPCGTEQVNDCGTETCVLDCKGHFKDWSECLGTGPDPLCDKEGTQTGTQSRKYIVTQKATQGGCECDGQDEDRTCSLPCCPEKCEGSWGEWGKCEGAQSYDVDGGYGETACCGGGTRTKKFTVTKEKVCGGECCPAVDGQEMSEACCEAPCPIDCVGKWGPKSECSAKCDEGTTTQIYKVTQIQMHGGEECPHSCGDEKKEPCIDNPPCPVNCTGYWGPWDDCSQTCKHWPRIGHPHPNGTVSRQFIVTREASNGGVPCSECGKEQTKKCGDVDGPYPEPPEPCPVPAVCKWDEWGECSEPCFDSERVPAHYVFRKRKWIEVKPAKHGGKECKHDPPAYEPDEEECVVDCCPKPCIGGWGKFDTCTADISVPGGYFCGNGSKTRVYSIQKEAICGGQECCHKHGDEDSVICGDECCEKHCDGDWTEWSSCCVSCSKTKTLPGRGGTRSRIFNIAVDSDCNGTECKHKDGYTEIEKCNENVPCKIPCQGSWGSWSACSQPCTDCEGYGSVGSKSRKFTVTQSAMFGGEECKWAHGTTEEKTCNDKCCEVPCKGSWGEFSECSATCGNGIKKRKFTVSQPALYGGEPCKHCDNKTHTVECNEGPCAVDCCGKWSAWSHCSAECGGGKKSSWFQVTTQDQNGGQKCKHGAWEQRQESCNEHDCFQPCIGGFGPWSKCDAACAGGKKSRTYAVQQPLKGVPPMIPGFDAGYGPGPGECAHEDAYVQTKDCNQHDCPTGYDCPKDKPCNGR